jgi:2'-hydroxyisoflavone reductase
LKAASEDEALMQFGAQACTLIRPGLIVGPGDETDRFSYWPLRLRRGGAMLVPPRQDPVKYIDARDLAEWTVRLAEQRLAGAFNAFGPERELRFGDLLDEMRAEIGSDARLVEASQAFLAEHKVAPWADLPLWLPGQGPTAGFHRRRNARALASGLHCRPPAETARDLLAWWDGLPAERREAPLRAGLTPEREAELLRLLQA